MGSKLLRLIQLAVCLTLLAGITAPRAAQSKSADQNTVQASLYATAISAGAYHTCILTNAGGVKCWGNNNFGQLGDNTNTDRWTPVEVMGLTSGVKAIATGAYHTCVLTDAGGVKCWGNIYQGEPGSNTGTTGWTPMDVIGLTNGVKAIAAGDNQACALTEAGGVKCWGNNEYGQLGDNSTLDRWAPVDVVGLGKGVGAISAGGWHTCALLDSGGVKCWGHNEWGESGDGTNTNRLTPVDVVGLSSGVKAISAGSVHTCALLSGGGVKCWGYNLHGELGDNTADNRWTPTDVFGLSSGVMGISAGGWHTCGLIDDGGVKCWGSNDYGELGDNSDTSSVIPVDVVGLNRRVTAISAGDFHTCAVTGDGGVKCWGKNTYGQLGDNTNTDRWTPVDVLDIGSPPGQKSWLVMVYLAGDNNLFGDLLNQFNHLKSTTNPNIDIAVLFDGNQANDSQECFISETLSCNSITEILSSSPWQLSQFMDRARKKSTAASSAFILMDHGNLTGVAVDHGGTPPFLGVFDMLNYSNLAFALQTYSETHGKLDVLFTDVCLGGFVEVGYEIQDYVDYLVASENLIFTNVFDLQSVGPATTPEELAKLLAWNYYDQSKSEPFPATISVAKLSRATFLADKIRVFASTLKDLLPTAATSPIRSDILAAVQRFDTNGNGILDMRDEAIDLYDFAWLVSLSTNEPTLKAAAQAVMEAIEGEAQDRYIIFNKVYSGQVRGTDGITYQYSLDRSHGVAIFFNPPDQKRSFYSGTIFKFAYGTDWNLGPLSSRVNQAGLDPDPIGWGSLLVALVETDYPNAGDDPNPPPLVAPISGPFTRLIFIPLVVQ